ncbi:MAG: hypothetical protein HRT89_08630 [Lentisphaeria bacterium]|nr:hypothetical protein [Lentisphaeria bacterium]
MRQHIIALYANLKDAYKIKFRQELLDDNKIEDLLDQVNQSIKIGSVFTDSQSALDHWLAETPHFYINQADQHLEKYLYYLSYKVHIWRQCPSISEESNALRNQLQFLRNNYEPYYNYLNILLVGLYLETGDKNGI